MRTIEEINAQIEKEYNDMNELYSQINVYEQKIRLLKAEREDIKKEEEKLFIDKWFNKQFGILNQKEARQKSIFIVFDKNGELVKTVTTGYGEEFHYVSPEEDKDTLAHWLRENKLYAHRASSFCDRNRAWYNLPLKEQLEYLGWEFDENGELRKTQW